MTNKLKIYLILFLRHTFTFIFSSARFLQSFLKKTFSKKTIVFVSKQKLRSYSIGPKAQVIFLLLILWLGIAFAKSARYGSALDKKSAEISDLKKANQQFESEVDFLNSNLQKMNSYFRSISGSDNKVDENLDKQSIDQKMNDIFSGINLNKKDKEIAVKIADSNLILGNIKESAIKRIEDLEHKLSFTGIAFVNNKAVLRSAIDSNKNDGGSVISLNNKSDLTKKQGGPFQTLKRNIASIAGSKLFSNNGISIKNEIEYLVNLENFIRHVPLAAPMKDYYVSSGFGKRVDPVKGVFARHEGMDFVGKNSAKIFSPSPGKVIFAGKFGSYGNAIVIEHGYGITTRYGHLSKIYVDKGSYVKKDQMVALQGSTGRSTGQHLHYEVRYKNIPLNPKGFLQAGQEILSSSNVRNL